MGGLDDLDYLVKLAESELNFAKENLKFCRQMLTAMKIFTVFIVIWFFLIIVSFFVFDNTLLTYILKVIGMVLTPFFFMKYIIDFIFLFLSIVYPFDKEKV